MKNNLPLGNLIYSLSKTGSRTYYKIYEDADNPWFIYVLHFDKKKNELKNYSMIIAKDLPKHIEMLNSDDWVETLERELTYNIKNQQDSK
jgi:hypothetical protein